METYPGVLGGYTMNLKKALDSADIYISGTVNEVMVGDFINEYKKLLPGKKQLVIYFSSPGGSVSSALMVISILKQIKKRGIKLIMVGVEDVSSCAIDIFMQSDLKYALKFTEFVLHKTHLKTNERLTSNYLKIAAKHLANCPRDYSFITKKLKLTKTQLDTFNSAEDLLLTSAEAVKAKLIIKELS